MTSGKSKKRKDGASQAQGKGNAKAKAKAKQKFYKPSKPVPTLDRSAVSADNPLGDHAPAGHHRYRPERWTGNLSLSLEARTPLLLLDGFSCRVDGNGHKTLDTRAQLLRTQLKGALRSAYEMITNSRLGCVKSSHSEPLQFRPPGQGAKKQPYECAPMEIFKIKKINPASCLKELSPAERVFGWVNPEGKGAYKGQLRVSRLELDNPPPPNNGPERTLAPLSSPRPEYVRFYGAEDLDGRPFPRWDKAKGYTKTAGDAGRNDYFTHPDKPEGYFGADVTPDKQFKHDGRTYYPEYLVDEKSDQNMTVLGEVPAGTRFSACIQFRNLSDEELGALLWLLTLEDEKFESNGNGRTYCKSAYYSVGSGKPFGFGSIRISLASLNAWRGQALKARYASLLDPDKAEPVKNDQVWFEYTESAQSNEVIEGLKKKFEDALEGAYGKNKRKRLLRIFKEHRHGPQESLPVHYPRTSKEPGEPFEWFKDSEKPAARWFLGDTWNNPGSSFALPYQPVNPSR